MITRVLLIEDNPALQRAASYLIQRVIPKAAIDVATTAPSALVYLGSCQYDLILSDYDLGDTSGGEVLAYLREYLPDMVEKFVFFSGTQGLERQHHKVIEKGIRTEDFVDQLRRYMAS